MYSVSFASPVVVYRVPTVYALALAPVSVYVLLMTPPSFQNAAAREKKSEFGKHRVSAVCCLCVSKFHYMKSQVTSNISL
jgi:hypothetical protein